MANCFILIPAVNPEIYTLPRLLFADCITMLPMAVMEYCRPIGTPIVMSCHIIFPFACLS